MSTSQKVVVVEKNEKKRPSSGKKKQKHVWVWTPECKYTVILKKVKDINLRFYFYLID